MQYKIELQWQHKRPQIMRIYDPITGLQRDAIFNDIASAMEAGAIINRLITASPYNGHRVIEVDNG